MLIVFFMGLSYYGCLAFLYAAFIAEIMLSKISKISRICLISVPSHPYQQLLIHKTSPS
jgi:hypothetical protein